MPVMPFLGLEMTLVRMACIGRVQPLQTILEHLQRLETGLPAVPVPAAAEEERPAAVRARPARNGPAEHTQTSVRSTEAAEETVSAPVPAMSLSEAPQNAVLSTAEGLWEALQQRVTERRPLLGGYMQQGRPLTLDEHKLVIGFANKYFSGQSPGSRKPRRAPRCSADVTRTILQYCPRTK